MKRIAILTQEKYKTIAWLFPIGGCHIFFDHTNRQFDWNNYDLVISLLYNKIIKNDEFDIPKLGTINIHPSLLPFHRGSCPNFWAILSGDGAGWTAHRMTAEIDRGDIYLQQEVPVLLSDTAETLWDRLFDELPSFLSQLAELIYTGNLEPLDVQQDNDNVKNINQFNRLHDVNNIINVMYSQSQKEAFAAMVILDTIRACSFDGYEGFVMDTPDGRVEFKARRIE